MIDMRTQNLRFIFMNFFQKLTRGVLPILFLCVAVWAQQRQSSNSLSGQVVDQFDAAIVGASVSAIDGKGGEKNTVTDGQGRFVLTNLKAGFYTLRIAAKGFAALERANVEVAANRNQDSSFRLEVALENQEVNVGDESGNLSADAEKNASATTLGEKEIEALPEDADELNAALQTLAGAAIGPDGGQILVDGFINTGQPLPPRSSIREIRINQNPFSAENDRVGFGQIQIITRPGTQKFQGEAFFNFSDESFNSRNPFVPNRAAYQTRFYGINLSGPIIKNRASFSLFFNERELDDNVAINATILDSALNVISLRQTVITPRRTTAIYPRFDYQINPNNLLTARYSVLRSSRKKMGVGGFALPERAFDTTNAINTLELTEAAVIKAKYINEFRLQFIGENQIDEDANANPGINVLGAFAAGGSGTGLARNPEGRLTVQDSLLWTAGKHTLRTGARLRRTTIEDFSPDFFNGIFTFGGGIAPRLDGNSEIIFDANGQPITETITSLERYRRTLFFKRRGLSAAEIRTRGGGATQFRRGDGDALAFARQVEFGAYVQDDWRVSSTLNLSFGLRSDFQTNIKSGLNLAPRFSFAWIPKFLNPKPQQPQTIIRGGFGVFFDRLNENQVLNSNRFRNANYFQYTTGDASILDAFPNAISITRLREILGNRQTVWQLADDLRAPYMTQAAISVERQLPLKTTFSATFIFARGFHALRARNVNAPVITRNAAGEIVSSLRPFPNRGEVYQYESSGNFRQRQLLLTLNNRLNQRVSFYVNYTLNKTTSDTDGVGSFPANSYDLSAETGRAANDARQMFSVGGSFELPFKIRLSPLVFASSGLPFNITIGRDANLDSIFSDRPAFADDLNKPGVIITRFGAFDPNPSPAQRIIPRNFGNSPAFFVVNLSATRTFKFGKTKTVNGKKTEKPYALLFGIRAVNLFNRVNFAVPIGNLSSPFFGQSLATSGGFGAGNVGNPAAGNRRIETQIRFNF